MTSPQTLVLVSYFYENFDNDDNDDEEAEVNYGIYALDGLRSALPEIRNSVDIAEFYLTIMKLNQKITRYNVNKCEMVISWNLATPKDCFNNGNKKMNFDQVMDYIYTRISQ